LGDEPPELIFLPS